MITAALLLLGAQAQADPPENAMNGAIFDDVQSNAMIGNGNDLLSWDWVGYGDDHPPEITLSERHCQPRRGQRRCAFLLTRKPDPQSTRDETGVPRQLACTADLRIDAEDGKRVWYVVHKRNPTGGHSRTSMTCRIVREP